MNKKVFFATVIICLATALIVFSVIKKKYENRSHRESLLLNAQLLKAQQSINAYNKFAYYSATEYENNLKIISNEDYNNARLIANPNENVNFCIVVPSYNNFNYVTQNINSIFKQKYHNWRLIFIDDLSNDGMTEIINKIKSDSKLPDSKFTLKINNQRTRSALFNYYYASHNFCKDNEVLFMLDGDDMMAHSEVLANLAKEYANPNTWLTYGNQLVLINNIAFDTNKEIPESNWSNLRNIEFTTSHPHTVYVWLFNKIQEQDLKFDGKFFTSAWDLAFMLPILEMAGPNRSKSLDDLLYIYRSHQNNDGKLYPEEQKKFEKHIRSKKPYDRLPNELTS